MPINEVKRLRECARLIRHDIVTAVHLAGDGHPGPALSIADLIAALYFRILKINPEQPRWPDRDRFLLSKGHACPAMYSALARRGFFSPDLLPTLRSLGSILQGHPEMKVTPGVDMTTGSLGHGMGIGAGMAAAGRLQGKDYRVYVITGDGELNEGICWEAAQSAAHLELGHLTVFVDFNGFQSGGTLQEVSGMERIGEKFEAFGWHVQTIDGHDFEQIIDAESAARLETRRPSAVVAKTIKGKGVSFIEGDNSWHKRVPTAAELEVALTELGDQQ